jgi:Tfp pilus assembly protein PilZ
VEDKRVHPRVALEIEVSCERRGLGAFMGKAKDISIGGMFIDSTEAVSFGTDITIVARLPGTKADVRLPGIVRWVKPGGFGVQFGLLGARETHAISEILKR